MSFQELGLLPLRFVLALISSFSWHVSRVPARCLGSSRDHPSVARSNATLIVVFMQESACFACATCALRNRLFPFWCHARFAAGSRSHWRSGLTKYVYAGSFVALYRILLNTFPLLFSANAPFRLSLPWSPSPAQFDDSADCNFEPDSTDDNILVVKKTARLSSAAQAHQTRSARWHSIVAGAVAGGVAISFESLSRRKVIAQQLFVR